MHRIDPIRGRRSGGARWPAALALAVLAGDAPAQEGARDSEEEEPARAGAPASTAARPFAPVTRPGDGAPVCGLGADFHAGRRAALRAAVGEGVLVFRGLPPTRDYVEFRQDETYWYLTGVESPDAALVMDAESGREVLFLPRAQPRIEGWEGELWDASDAWVPELTGFEEVRPTGELVAVARELAGEDAPVWTSLYPHVEMGGAADRAGPYDARRESDPLDGRTSRERALAAALEDLLGREVKDCSLHLERLRRVKTPEEIEAMRRAGRAGSEAMAEAMRSTRPGLGEWDLDALMTWDMVRRGADGPGYYAIVGSGPSSCVLHYNASARRMRAGEIVLVDFGPDLDHYVADITRAWPVDGEFTPRMAEIYDAVLAAQKAGIQAVKPGVTMQQVERECRRVLAEHGFGDTKWMPHGACHYIGLEVHDAGLGRAPLEPGVAITVEPGVYDAEAGIGVRIEDVVIVTEEGCEVVTSTPKEREQVAELVRSPGILDWIESQGR